MTPDRLGILVLAAGGSTRMRRSKQLLHIGGRPLVRRATETALATGGWVVVVIGADGERVAAEVQDLPVQIAENRDWRCGMGSSIRCGVRAMTDSRPDLAAMIVTLCDQVDVSIDTLDRLWDAHGRTGKGLCGASFDDTVGPPALFGRQYFTELLHLPDAAGAKSLLLSQPADLVRVPCPDAIRDLDTWEDFERLSQADAARESFQGMVDRMVGATASTLKIGAGNARLLRAAIASYVRSGRTLGLSSSELRDLLWGYSPNVIDLAGYSDDDAQLVLAIFDGIVRYGNR